MVENILHNVSTVGQTRWLRPQSIRQSHQSQRHKVVILTTMQVLWWILHKIGSRWYEGSCSQGETPSQKHCDRGRLKLQLKILRDITDKKEAKWLQARFHISHFQILATSSGKTFFHAVPFKTWLYYNESEIAGWRRHWCPNKGPSLVL